MTHDPKGKIKAELAKNHTCYLLITCNGPNHEGEMDVEMDYEGDPVLVSYLLQGAQNVLDEQESMKAL